MLNIHVSLKKIWVNDFRISFIYQCLIARITPYRKQDASSILVEISEKSVYPAPSNKWKQIKTNL